MLPKNRRLTNEEIETVIRKGVTNHTPFLYIKSLLNNSENTSFTVVVSSKVNKKAVVRNKIKRQIRAFLIRKKGQFKNGYNIVFITKPGVTNLKLEDLQSAILYLLSKNKII